MDKDYLDENGKHKQLNESAIKTIEILNDIISKSHKEVCRIIEEEKSRLDITDHRDFEVLWYNRKQK